MEKVTQNGVDVYFPRLEQRWTFNPKTLKRLAPFSIGEIVRVRDDEGTTRKVKLEFGEKVAENVIELFCTTLLSRFKLKSLVFHS